MASDQGNAGPIAVEAWLNTRPSWLRAAALGLISNRRMPSEPEIDVLATHCLQESAKRLEKPESLLAEGMIAGTPGRAGLRLERVFDIRGVNALGAKATLDLTDADLAIIYGANGSGKSGYARLMKHLCGARVAGTIHGNAFEHELEEASATVEVRAISASGPVNDAVPHKWQASQGPLKVLKAIPVFDAATAVEFGNSASAATHTPRSMQFVSSLIQISDQVADNLRQRAKGLATKMPSLPPDLIASPAAATLRQLLRAKTTQAAIDAACGMSVEQRAELVGLAAALAQANPAVAHAKVVADLEQLAQKKASALMREEALGGENATGIVTARLDAVTKREAASAHAAAFFKGLPLMGVGEAAWRELWSAAEAYSQTKAYPEHIHPNTGVDARCVLCQQVLDPEATARLEGFGAFVQNRLESDAALAERRHTALLDGLKKVPDEEAWSTVSQSIGLDPQEGEFLRKAVEAQTKALGTATTLQSVPVADWLKWHSAHQSTVAALEAQRDALAPLVDIEGRKKKEARLVDLQGMEWLATNRTQIANEVARLRTYEEIDAAIRLAATNALTSRNNEVGASELARGFCERFNAEMQRLGGQGLPIVMTHQSKGKGHFAFCAELRNPRRRIHNKDVLSEGEQRIVALAAFLADATGSDRVLPIVFDDPISSLDQRFEEAVANRLADLAETRQVLMFTHRLSLMVLLKSAKKRKEAHGSQARIKVLSITRDGLETGVPSTIDAFSLGPKEGLNKVVSDTHLAKKQDVEIRKALLKSACSNLRILVERSVEEKLCSGVVVRFRREIKTLNLIKRLAAIRPTDCALIDDMMTKYSAFEHSQPIETPTWLPDPDELIADAESILKWISEFDKHAQAVAAGTVTA